MILGTNYLKKATPVFLRGSLLYKSPIFQVFQSPVSHSLSLSLSLFVYLNFFIDSWWLSHHASLSHSSHPLASALYPCNPLPPEKFKSNIKKQNKTKNLSVEVVVWSSGLHSIFFRPYIFTCKYSLQ